ncbi:hypothetical protein EI555_020309 [Monodon monoceros]|uniref:Platelet-derived growth factor C n=1 Tax=Monodon monoceros TaxID=40151 RepID=A0A4U1F5T0_MONMO|nr:hypothetical protein EI555_020309 [Monodon monoceros]
MLLFGLLLLTSALAGQRPGTRAESSLSSKLQLASTKEQNGVQDPQHERIITVSTNGSIHSPRFPHTYPRNMVLVWRLVAVEENVWIQLTFDERFGLEDPEDDICKYDFVEVEEPSDGAVLGRWCGSGTVPGKQISKGNQIRIRFVSDKYFPSEPGFCIHYNIVMPGTDFALSLMFACCAVTSWNSKQISYFVTRCQEGCFRPQSAYLTSCVGPEGTRHFFKNGCRLTLDSFYFQQLTETVSPSVLPAAALPLDLLNNAVTAFSTLEDLIRYLEPDRWQLDLEDLYRPTWQLLGKAFVFGRKSRVLGLNLLKEEVRLYSCTPRNFSVSIREELKRTDTVFWPGCLLVKRCGGNCACCLHTCSECQCVPSKVTKKYHEVLQLRPKTGVRGLHKSLTDVALEHHEECDCVCRGNPGG